MPDAWPVKARTRTTGYIPLWSLYGLVCIVAIAGVCKTLTFETSLVRLQPGPPVKWFLNCVAQRISLSGAVTIIVAALIIGDDASSRGCVSRLLYAIVAQLVEQKTFNFWGRVSITLGRTNICLWLGKQSCGDADKIEERASHPWAGIRIRYAPIA